MAKTAEEKRACHREWYLKNRDAVLERMRVYRADNADKIAAYQKSHRESNRERLVEKSKRYYHEHRAQMIASAQERYRSKRDEIIAYKKRWANENQRRIAAQRKAFREANKERLSADKKARYAANPETTKRRTKSYYDVNRDSCLKAGRVRSKRWALAHPDRRNESSARRRARVKRTRVEKINYKQILRDSCGICGICRKPLDLFGIEFDHIVPLAVGGTHTQDNLQAAHALCNRSKGARVA